jgi:hypothetical protein
MIAFIMKKEEKSFYITLKTFFKYLKINIPNTNENIVLNNRNSITNIYNKSHNLNIIDIFSCNLTHKGYLTNSKNDTNNNIMLLEYESEEDETNFDSQKTNLSGKSYSLFNNKKLNYTKPFKINEGIQWIYKFAQTPQQINNYDGGVFICKYIEYLSRGEPITFSCEDIDYFRMLIGVELVTGNLL